MSARLLARLAVLCASMAVFASTVSLADSIDPFIGEYVGRAEVFGDDGTVTHIRDMDIEITRHKRNGLRIRWFNVTLVDGRRDVPGVVRQVSEVILTPHEDRQFFVETEENNPFREKEDFSALAGDPLRWALIEDGTIYFYSFQKLPDSRYELQIYTRTLTDIGLDLEFERIVDGSVQRAIAGRTVRATD
jgi:hypothetical protein